VFYPFQFHLNSCASWFPMHHAPVLCNRFFFFAIAHLKWVVLVFCLLSLCKDVVKCSISFNGQIRSLSLNNESDQTPSNTLNVQWAFQNWAGASEAFAVKLYCGWKQWSPLSSSEDADCIALFPILGTWWTKEKMEVGCSTFVTAKFEKNGSMFLNNHLKMKIELIFYSRRLIRP